MSSLYSAQAVIAAREQLNSQLEQKGGSVPTASSPIPHYNPHHYHQTVHEKCKHHNQPHSKQGEKQAENEGLNEAVGSLKRMIVDHEEVKEEMRAWSRLMQAWAKGQHKLNDKELHQHHQRLYKWMLFLQDIFTSYESTFKTQTSLHALEQEEQHSNKLIQDPHGVPSSHRPSHSGGVKLPHILSRERMEFLEARVVELQHRLDAQKQVNQDITRKLKELSTILAKESEEKLPHQSERVHGKQIGLIPLLVEMEEFCLNLSEDLTKPEKLKNEYPKIVEQKLTRIREERKKLEKCKK